MKVKRYNYPAQFGDQLDSLASKIAKMLSNGQYVLSQQVLDFESRFAQYLGIKHALGVNSGTDALLLSMMALDIGPGDEVITQANTFHATVAAICLCGAKPVLVDVTEDAFQMDPGQLADAVTPRTRAIIPVHLYGYPAPLRQVQSVAQSHSLDIIEDAAQAHGALLDQRRVGTHGRVGCFSFHPSKNLAAAGDGGAIATNDDELAKRITQLRSLGQASQNNHVRVGLNSKLDAIQAAVLQTKLPYLDKWNEQRRHVARLYHERLAELPIGLQQGENLNDSVYHLFQLRTAKRDALLDHLRQHDVDAVTRYPVPIHLQPAFAGHGWKPGQFPIAEQLASQLLCLPIRPDMPVAEVDFVAEKVRVFFEGN